MTGMAERGWAVQPVAWGPALLPAAVKFLLHALAAGQYGYFRDELYFLDCARHLQWGYVDDTPGIVLLAKLALGLGGSLPVVRLLAALGGAATVLAGSLVARELGGGRFAQAFTGLCVLAAPVFLVMDGTLCVGVLEPLAWMGCALFLARIARTGEARLWLGLGLAAGLGVEIKYTMLLVLACLLAAMLLTPARRELRRPAFWAGAGLALLIALPTLAWQVRQQYPLLVDLENIRRTGKNVVLGPWAFIGQQVLFLNPLLLPVWGLGLAWLFRHRRLRVLGWWYVLLLAALIAVQGKAYYLAASYPMLFAAGAVALEQALDRPAWRRRRWPRAALAGLAAACGLVLAPALVPWLPPGRLLAYRVWLGLSPPPMETEHTGPLDQLLGDQFGWPELAGETAAIYHGLEPGEHRHPWGMASENRPIYLCRGPRGSLREHWSGLTHWD